MAYTDYGLKMFLELKRQGKTMKWLAEQVKAETGLYCDSQYLYKIATGQRDPEKIKAAVNNLLGLSIDYELSNKTDS